MLRPRSARLCTTAAFLALAVVSWVEPSRAYCRAVTVQPPKNYDPVEGGCQASGAADSGAPRPLFWPNQCMGYSLQQNASRFVSLDQARTAASLAFAAWADAPCDGGSPSIFPQEFPAVACDKAGLASNPIVFRDDFWPHDDKANAIGFTTLTVRLSTGQIVGAAIEINTANNAISATEPAPSGGYDLQSILTHEAGHFLGMAHSASTNAVMYAYYPANSTTLTQDDIDGICAVYPPGEQGGQGTTLCNAQPPAGFQSSCVALDAGGLAYVGSGVLPAATDAPCTNDWLGCAVGRVRGSPSGAAFVVAGIVLAALARRRRVPRVVVAAALATGAASLMCLRHAEASVSLTVLLDELVRESSGAAVVSPIEHHAVWEDDRIVTYTRVRVERVVAGSIAEPVWVRTLGGEVGDIGQIVEGEAQLAAGQSSLFFLRPHLDPVTRRPTGAFAVAEGAQGQFPVVAPAGGKAHLELARDLGALYPPSEAQRKRSPTAPIARDALCNRPLEAALRAIVEAWRRIRGG